MKVNVLSAEGSINCAVKCQLILFAFLDGNVLIVAKSLTGWQLFKCVANEDIFW
jgi:hypothetical protein